MHFNWLDGLLTIILVVNMLYGLRRGLLRTFFGALGALLGLLFCIFGAPATAELLQAFKISGTAAYLTALILIFILVYFLINEIGRHLQAIIKKTALQTLDQVCGLFGGFGKGVLYALLLIFPLWNNNFFSPAMTKTLMESALVNKGWPLVRFSEPLIQDLFHHASRSWQKYHSGLPKREVSAPPPNLLETISAPPSLLPEYKSLIYY
jgi:uncharacterized membrane protein required for colicin V production